MSPETQSALNQLNEDLLTYFDEVEAAIETRELAQELAAGKHVEELAERYAKLTPQLSAAEFAVVDRGLGRRIIDLRRNAMSLTRRMKGQATNIATDVGLPFLMERKPSKPFVEQRPVITPKSKYSVGGDVDCWCGKCAETREHRIVAMVGDVPKQVMCAVCGSRHGFRAAKPLPRQATAVAVKGPQRAGEVLADRKVEEKIALGRELATAEARPFDPKERYKVGEVIAHPEHGRGKIDHVERKILLVKFPIGLRRLSLQ